jgi:hypothetical protein
MGQRLVVIGDRPRIDRHRLRRGDREWRELPQAAEQAVGRAAREHELAGLLDPDQRALEQRQVRGLPARRDHRQLGLPRGPRRRARPAQRTRQAARLGRRADRGAELHQPLVEIPRPRVGR